MEHLSIKTWEYQPRGGEALHLHLFLGTHPVYKDVTNSLLPKRKFEIISHLQHLIHEKVIGFTISNEKSLDFYYKYPRLWVLNLLYIGSPLTKGQYQHTYKDALTMK